MSHDEHVQQTSAALLAVDWADDLVAWERTGSRGHLMVEYLRRAALWVEALGITEGWPFLDVAAHAAPGVRAPDAVLARLDRISVHIAWPPVRTVVEGALHWAAVRDAGVEVPDLPDPYEPLLLMFARGGAFTTEHNFVDTGGLMIPIRTWRERRAQRPIASLDPAALDALDRRA